MVGLAWMAARDDKGQSSEQSGTDLRARAELSVCCRRCCWRWRRTESLRHRDAGLNAWETRSRFGSLELPVCAEPL